MRLRGKANRLVSALSAALLLMGTLPVSSAAEPAPAGTGKSYAAYWQPFASYPSAKAAIIPAIETAQGVTVSQHAGKTAALLSEGETAVWSLEAPEDAYYVLEIQYMAAQAGSGNLELSFRLDGKTPFEDVTVLSLPRSYTQTQEDFPTNAAGNDQKPEVKEAFLWKTYCLADPSGYRTSPYFLGLNQGSHTLELTGAKGQIAIASVRLAAYQPPVDYQDYLEEHRQAGAVPASGAEPIVIEAEKLRYKNAQTILPVTDRSSAVTTPQSGKVLRLNALGGNNWARIGDSVTWTFHVKTSGLYQIGVRFQQSFVDGIFTSRKLLLDDELPFEQAGRLRFAYSSDWQVERFGEGGTPYLFYLEEGEHTLTLEATAGGVAEMVGVIEDSVSELNTIYRRIVRITGTSPDPYRDYGFEGLIPDEIAAMAVQRDKLQEAVDAIDKAAGSNGSYTSVLKKIIFQLDRMAKKPKEIAKTLENFKSNLGAMGSWLLSAMSQPLLLDQIFIEGQDAYAAPRDGFFQNLWFGLTCFFHSFTADYSSLGQMGDAQYDKTLKIWTQAGRDQAEVLRGLIDSSFSAQYQTGVQLETVAQGTLLQSVLAGLAPDVVLDNPSSEPINYAIRNAVTDVSQFPDYAQVAQRFPASASVPYTYQGKTYALPQTFSFLMFFYRTDIFEEYGLSAPETWDDFIKVAAILQKDGLTVGLPHDLYSYAMFLYQNEGSFYTPDFKKTNLNSNTAIDSFIQLTEFFSLYGLPPTFDFANRFRSGEMPCAVQDYTQYNQLTVFAPEIKGRWKMVEVPGTPGENGEIRRYSVGNGTAAMLLRGSQNQQAGWEFLKWFTETGTQSRYAMEMESVLGPAGKVATANWEAMGRMSWSREEYTALTTQLKKVKTVPEVPGSYYLPRIITFAFNRVYNASGTQSMAEEPAEVLGDYIAELNFELARKQAEFEER